MKVCKKRVGERAGHVEKPSVKDLRFFWTFLKKHSQDTVVQDTSDRNSPSLHCLGCIHAGHHTKYDFRKRPWFLSCIESLNKFDVFWNDLTYRTRFRFRSCLELVPSIMLFRYPPACCRLDLFNVCFGPFVVGFVSSFVLFQRCICNMLRPMLILQSLETTIALRWGSKGKGKSAASLCTLECQNRIRTEDLKSDIDRNVLLHPSNPSYPWNPSALDTFSSPRFAQGSDWSDCSASSSSRNETKLLTELFEIQINSDVHYASYVLRVFLKCQQFCVFLFRSILAFCKL